MEDLCGYLEPGAVGEGITQVLFDFKFNRGAGEKCADFKNCI